MRKLTSNPPDQPTGPKREKHVGPFRQSLDR